MYEVKKKNDVKKRSENSCVTCRKICMDAEAIGSHRTITFENQFLIKVQVRKKNRFGQLLVRIHKPRNFLNTNMTVDLRRPLTMLMRSTGHNNWHWRDVIFAATINGPHLGRREHVLQWEYFGATVCEVCQWDLFVGYQHI